jgi:ferredoxin-type protein NapH
VISAPLKAKAGASPVIISGDCTNCGRCIDVCATDVFTFTHRFDRTRNEGPLPSSLSPSGGGPGARPDLGAYKKD